MSDARDGRLVVQMARVNRALAEALEAAQDEIERLEHALDSGWAVACATLDNEPPLTEDELRRLGTLLEGHSESYRRVVHLLAGHVDIRTWNMVRDLKRDAPGRPAPTLENLVERPPAGDGPVAHDRLPSVGDIRRGLRRISGAPEDRKESK